jgi:excisionase family DNA binding protein
LRTYLVVQSGRTDRKFHRERKFQTADRYGKQSRRIAMKLVARQATFRRQEVAAALGVVPSTIRKMVSQGRLKAVWVGSQRRFTISEVRRAIAERMLGHKPGNSRETSQGMIQWGRGRLGISDDVSP